MNSSHQSHPSYSSFANEGNEPVLIGLCNDLVVQHDGWAMLSPYGDFPGKAIVQLPNGLFQSVDAIQRVDKIAAEEMVREFKSLLGTAKRFVRGRKLFIGHPDVPALANDYADKSPKGVFVDLEARQDGLFGKPILTEEGSDLVENQAYKALSPYWTANELPDENGKKVFRPNVFKSAGLTNRPQLPVRHLMNEAEQPDPTLMNKSKVLAWLKQHGIELANEATDDQIETALAQIGTKLTTVANEKTTAETALANEKTTLVAKTTENTALASERDTLKTQFANERKAHITLLLDTAIAEGRITPAQRVEWTGKLESNFANEAAALSKLQSNLKIRSAIGDIGNRKAEIANAQDRQAKVQAAVNKRIADFKEDYDTAFANVRRDNAALFEAMQQPAVAAR